MIFFVFLHENISCGYTLELPLEAISMSTHMICLYTKIKIILNYCHIYQVVWSYDFMIVEMNNKTFSVCRV